MQRNRLIYGDNLEVLATMDKESVDLIYIDPPFFSNRNYEIIWGDEAEIRSFEDRWEGGINVYVDWMKDRVMELHRVLKPTGTFYLHCDWHAGHYLKVMCDEVFEYDNFRNEIIWHYRRWTAPAKKFQKLHDTIFFYTKSANYTFNPLLTSYTKGSTERKMQGILRRFKKGEPPRLVSDRELQKEGVPENDVWCIPFIAPSAKERLGYPTQKPEALLEKIVAASSNKGDVILDAFCGCGTALVVAQKLGRNWIGIDISPSAISLIQNRFGKLGVAEGRDYEVIGMPKTVDELKGYRHYDFQYWVINAMHGTPSPRKAGDLGIDGFTFLEHYPIQVKQSERVGRNVVDNFETALRRYYKGHSKNLRGYIVAFSFTRGTREEVARAKREGIEIQLVEVQDILNKEFSVQTQIPNL